MIIKDAKLKNKIENMGYIYTTCAGCRYHGEPNGCNHPDGKCPAYDFLADLVAEIEAAPAFASVYANDPSNLVAEAFAELYPDAKYEAILAPSIVDPNGQIVVSCISFPSEQDAPDTVPVIVINSQAGVEVAAEALGKELIHVALGPDSLDGGEEYDKALKALTEKYDAIASARFPEAPEEIKHNGGGNNGEQ